LVAKADPGRGLPWLQNADKIIFGLGIRIWGKDKYHHPSIFPGFMEIYRYICKLQKQILANDFYT
jgi:hypothetical protein